ncbi:hypothetical protein SpAn4DRAFT_4985 [Sporomusa ovata]|uniref:Uncharacterized protein n=1 Tax=Sporomusa ovata TaxID=2378 RepID=A0A0U1KYB1_9FIRM|nr:hypothetical protein SpAn4DRAFT_4985 [Sporomusa ovata]
MLKGLDWDYINEPPKTEELESEAKRAEWSRPRSLQTMRQLL